MRKSQPKENDLQCSFCHKSQDVVGKLISSPSHHPRAYICDECVQVCFLILQDDAKPVPDPEPADPNPLPGHALMSHPLAPHLLAGVTEWMAAEAAGRDTAPCVANIRRVARSMFGMEPAPESSR